MKHLPPHRTSIAFSFRRLTCVLSALPTSPRSNRPRNRLHLPVPALSGRLHRGWCVLCFFVCSQYCCFQGTDFHWICDYYLVFADRKATARTTTFVEPCSICSRAWRLDRYELQRTYWLELVTKPPQKQKRFGARTIKASVTWTQHCLDAELRTHECKQQSHLARAGWQSSSCCRKAFCVMSFRKSAQRHGKVLQNKGLRSPSCCLAVSWRKKNHMLTLLTAEEPKKVKSPAFLSRRLLFCFLVQVLVENCLI